MPNEFPIFYDKTGKRWKITKIFLALGFIAAITLTVLLVISSAKPAYKPPVNYKEINNTALKGEARTPAEIAYSIDYNLPVIGEGTFIRVSKIQKIEDKFFAADVFSGQVYREILTSEIMSIQDKEYVIEKYGQIDGKKLILTFDDGPHPSYTPQILDVLSAEKAHSSFFPVGENIIKYPEIVKRIVKEGHDVANHTFSHVDLDLVSSLRAKQEINQTQRVINSVTGVSSSLFRIPYGGNDEASLIDDKRAILEAQKQGFILASYDIDTKDWEFNSATSISLPPLDGSSKVILLHDGGGDRAKSIEYLKAFIGYAKSKGYGFTSLSRQFTDYKLNESITPNLTDTASLFAAKSIFIWPKELVHILFFISMIIIFLSVILAIFLAELMRVYRRPKRRHNGYNPLVTVIIPAFNEEKVLQKTVSSVLRSYYRNIEIVIIDDGSSDSTWKLIQKLKKHKKVRGYRQINSGKARATNKGIHYARGEVVICIDADTVFLPATIGKMTKYFYYDYIGAVAGVVKVGNVNNWITRWQALEYITSINLERASQAFIRAIAIAPGACSAWRKDAVIKAGGFSSSTMAEDCDMTLMIHKLGYEVVQDMEAIAYTESPENLRDLAKQRFRWIFGTIQSYWKHKDMIFRYRYGWLGLYVIPKSMLSILIQLLFTPVLVFVAVSNLATGNLATIAIYSLLGFILLLITAGVALLFAKEKFAYLIATPTFRLVYSPLRSILLYLITLAAIGGLEAGWNKVARHNTASIIKS